MMLMLSMISFVMAPSLRAESIRLKAGECTKVDMVCYSPKALNLLRVRIDECKDCQLDLASCKKTATTLKEPEVKVEEPWYKKWYYQAGAGFLGGVAVGIIVSKNIK